MNQPALILVSAQEKDRLFAEKVAETIGARFEHVKEAELHSALDLHEDRCLVFYGLDSQLSCESFHRLLMPRVGVHGNVQHALLHPELVHLIGTLGSPEVEGLRSKGMIGSFIIRSEEEDPQTAGVRYGSLVRKMLAKRLPLAPSQTVDAPNFDSFAIELLNSGDRQRALAKLESLLSKEDSFPDRIRSKVLTAIDELLMNAIYDAPGRKMPESIFDCNVEVRIEDRGEEVQITVTDRQGTLKRSQVFSHVLRNYHAIPYQPESDSSAYGAGMGLAMTFRSSLSLLFSVDPGERTEVTLSFKKAKSLKGFLAQSRFVAVQINSLPS